MLMNIFVAAMCVVCLAGGIFAWWVDYGGDTKKTDDQDNNPDDTDR